MTRPEWKALHREARSLARNIASIDKRNPRGSARLRIDHGATWFNLDCVKEPGKPASVTVQPAIIRDRPITTRIAAELEWSRFFRTRPAYGAHERRRNIDAASACVADARSIRLSASIFQGMPS